MNKSENLHELATALAAAQSQIRNAARDAANPFFKSHYADLASVREAIQEPLAKHGLSYVQTFRVADHGVIVETTLLHASGQYIGGELLLTPTKQDPQSIGSAITYGRRYSLQAIVGIAADDDDGEAAVGRGSSPKPAVQRETAPSPAKAKKSDLPYFQYSDENPFVVPANLLDQAGDLGPLDVCPWGKSKGKKWIEIQDNSLRGLWGVCVEIITSDDPDEKKINATAVLCEIANELKRRRGPGETYGAHLAFESVALA